MLLANQILHILCIFIKPNVWYSWSLKILAIKRWFPFNFAKTLQGCRFVVGGLKSFKLLADICFENRFQNTILPSLLAPYTSIFQIWWTFAQIFDSLKFSKCQQLVFWKRSRQKHKFVIFLKGRCFVMGGPIDMNFGVFWETPVDFPKSVVFPKYNQSNVNLNVKNREKFNCL